MHECTNARMHECTNAAPDNFLCSTPYSRLDSRMISSQALNRFGGHILPRPTSRKPSSLKQPHTDRQSSTGAQIPRSVLVLVPVKVSPPTSNSFLSIVISANHNAYPTKSSTNRAKSIVSPTHPSCIHPSGKSNRDPTETRTAPSIESSTHRDMSRLPATCAATNPRQPCRGLDTRPSVTFAIPTSRSSA